MTYNNSVLPSKDDKLIDLCCKIPASSDVAGYKYAKGEDGEGVHSSPLSRTCPLLRFLFIGGRSLGVEGRKVADDGEERERERWDVGKLQRRRRYVVVEGRVN